jgi:hypothetical protein
MLSAEVSALLGTDPEPPTEAGDVSSELETGVLRDADRQCDGFVRATGKARRRDRSKTQRRE